MALFCIHQVNGVNSRNNDSTINIVMSIIIIIIIIETFKVAQIKYYFSDVKRLGPSMTA